jgi:putative transposase
MPAGGQTSLSAATLDRIKKLEKELARLRRATSDLTRDKLILQEAARETSELSAPQSDAGVQAAYLSCVGATSIHTGQDAAWGS